MEPVLYSAVDGASNDLIRQDLIANNLANINTPGFKANLYEAEVMYLNDASGINQVNGQTFIVQDANAIDTSPGEIRLTGRDLDIAVGGNGYIAIQAADGSEVYTKGGSLRIDSYGQLLTPAGFSVVGEGGPISIPPAKSVEIGSDGTISIIPVDGDNKTLAVVDKIKTVSLTGAKIQRNAQGFMQLKPGSTADLETPVFIQSGSLEGSNVSAIDQMVRMISASRDFDAQMKILSTVDEDSQKLAQVLQV